VLGRELTVRTFAPELGRLLESGAKQPFEQGRADLQELAGVVVKTQQVERVSTQLGVQVEAWCQREREAILSGKVVPRTARQRRHRQGQNPRS
jgi:hypothetical protein